MVAVLHFVTVIAVSSFTVPSTGIARVTLSDLRSKRKYAAGGIPFVLTDAVPSWSASRTWSVEWFAEHLGNETADYYPHNLHNVGHPWLMPMHRALRETFGSGAAERRAKGDAVAAERRDPGAAYAYIQWRVHLEAWERALRAELAPLPAFFEKDIDWMSECLPKKDEKVGSPPFYDDAWPVDNLVRHTQWMIVVLGEAGSGMFLHPDGLGTGVWQAHIVGRKKWVLCEPASRPHLYEPGDVDAMSPIDLNRFPRFKNAKCTSIVLQPGELLYYPGSWWHQTLNLDTPTIGFARRTVSKRNYNEVYAWFKQACDRPREDIRSKGFPGASPPLARSVCASLKRCKQRWRSMFSKAKASAHAPKSQRVEL